MLNSDVGIVDWESTNSNEAVRVKQSSMSAMETLESLLSVSGCCSLSMFDGCGGMSLALELERVPTVCPWEVQRDCKLDVIKNAVVLWKLANSRRVRFSWLAMPCRSWTMTRKPLLRSLLRLEGEPWVAMEGVYKQVMLVDDGNALIMFTAMYIRCCSEHNAGLHLRTR